MNSLTNKPHCHFIIAPGSLGNSHKSRRTGYSTRHIPTCMPHPRHWTRFPQTRPRGGVFSDLVMSHDRAERSPEMFTNCENYRRPLLHTFRFSEITLSDFRIWAQVSSVAFSSKRLGNGTSHYEFAKFIGLLSRLASREQKESREAGIVGDLGIFSKFFFLGK